RCPFVLVLRGGGLANFARRHPRRTRRCLRQANAVAVPSRFLLERMCRYRDDLRLLPNPLDLPRYQFRVRTAARPSLVWLRALHGLYNPTMAPEVLARLLPHFPDAQLIMVGPDKGDGSWQAVQETAKRLGVATRISMPGGVAKEDVPGWLKQGDIFLNTSRVDNTPVSVLEAMASGLCIVSTDVGGMPFLLDDGQDALL